MVLHQGTEVAATRLLFILYVMSQENAVEVLLPNLRNTFVEQENKNSHDYHTYSLKVNKEISFSLISITRKQTQWWVDMDKRV